MIYDFDIDFVVVNFFIHLDGWFLLSLDRVIIDSAAVAGVVEVH